MLTAYKTKNGQHIPTLSIFSTAERKPKNKARIRTTDPQYNFETTRTQSQAREKTFQIAHTETKDLGFHPVRPTQWQPLIIFSGSGNFFNYPPTIVIWFVLKISEAFRASQRNAHKQVYDGLLYRGTLRLLLSSMVPVLHAFLEKKKKKRENPWKYQTRIGSVLNEIWNWFERKIFNKKRLYTFKQ